VFPGDATRKHQLMPVSQECLSFLPPGAYRMHFDEKDTLQAQKAAVSFWKGKMPIHKATYCELNAVALFCNATIYFSITVWNVVLIPCSKDSISIRCLHVVHKIEHVISISACPSAICFTAETGGISIFIFKGCILLRLSLLTF
jgi:hypothetical protein